MKRVKFEEEEQEEEDTLPATPAQQVIPRGILEGFYRTL
jgi:hypothetical protein